jgi:hypothetical protein
VTVTSLMKQFKLDFIDLLKMDIEGAEDPVISEGGRWLSKVRMICLETHGSVIEKRLIPLLTGRGFTCTRIRNVWYCDGNAKKPFDMAEKT